MRGSDKATPECRCAARLAGARRPRSPLPTGLTGALLGALAIVWAVRIGESPDAVAAAGRDGGPGHRLPLQLGDRQAYLDGHTRPRALAVDAGGALLYVALSTADRMAIVDVTGAKPRRLDDVPICAFPDALAALPKGGVVVSCRFDPALRVVTVQADAAGRAPRFQIRAVEAGPEHGDRAVAVDAEGRFAYVGTAARGGVKVVDLADHPGPLRFVPTGMFPEVIRFVPAGGAGPGAGTRPLLVVANLTSHTVGIHPVADDGGVGPAMQTIQTAAPVSGVAIVDRPGAAAGRAPVLSGLLLATYEDRTLSRERLAVEGLDSVILRVPFSGAGAPAPFADPGPGKRESVNLSERPSDPVVALDALAVDAASGRIAITGGGSDNLIVGSPDARSLVDDPTIAVGANPSAVAFLSRGRVVTADRLSDTLSFVTPPGVPGAAATVETLTVGRPERPTPAERGEALFYSRALVPNNVATGPLSIYTCAACHAEGHVDGRRHPSKRNRFYSMTKTCRGLAGTEPFLSVGEPDTFAAFADNIVATHAQGALDAPDSYDQYPVRLRLRQGTGWSTATLSPKEVRVALAAYMARIPVEPSPFAPPSRRAFSAPERRGLETFRADCAGCHQLLPSTSAKHGVAAADLERSLLAGQLVLTSARRYDVGTPVLREGGNNPPSLRGVWAAAPYFSDGSAASLEDVLRRTDPTGPHVHAPQNVERPPALTREQRADLAAFLRAL